MAGKLYVVATPIGNLGDLSERAARVLASVDLVAAEDTRVSRRVLDRLGVTAKLLSYREENERRLAPRLVEDLLAGKSIALVSDAGTPCISDPGYRLVSAAAQAGVEVVAVPGASAVVALLSISGLPTDRFAFEGFPPPRAGARRKMLEALRGGRGTVVFYESPRRVVRFLEEIAEVLGDPAVAVGRELTKLHEEVLRGPASAVASTLRERGVRGELTVAVALGDGGARKRHGAGVEGLAEGGGAGDDRTSAGDAREADAYGGRDVAAAIEALLDEGVSARDAARRLAPAGVPRRLVYEAARRRERGE